MQKIEDHLFTLWINAVQSYVIPWGVKLRRAKRQRNVGPPSVEFQKRLCDLGIDADSIWWGPMTLFPRKAIVLIDAIEKNPPRAVLEVGSGSSTPLLTALSKKHGFQLISLENHRGSFNYVRGLLDSTPGGREVNLINTGFVRHRYSDGKSYRWYDVDLGSYGLKFDFVVIDGPMGTLVGRNGALPEIAPHLAEIHSIYLDDSQREHEQNCIAEWEKYFPSLVVESIDGCRGMSRLHLTR